MHLATTLVQTAVDNDGVFTIDDYWLTLLLASAIPLLVDLVTQRFTTGWPKTVALVALSVLTALAQDLQAHGGNLNWQQLLTSFFLALTTAFATHNVIWKPIKVTGDQGAIQKATGSFGIPGPRKPADVPVGAAPGGAAFPTTRYQQGGPIGGEQAYPLKDTGERIYSADDVRRARERNGGVNDGDPLL